MGEQAQTVGVAVPIPPPWEAELIQARREAGDPGWRVVPPHITVLPPTPVPVAAFPAVERHLSRAAARVPPFVVQLRGTGTFRPVSAVVFAPLVRGIAGCEQLEQQVRRGPLRRPLQFPYHPHVTIAHDVDEPALDTALDAMAGFEARFGADRLRLYRHVDGAWHAWRDFPLGKG